MFNKIILAVSILIVAAACYLGSTAYSHADQFVATPTHIIRFSPGGSLGEFIQEYIEIDERHENVVIDGECISACTFVLGFVNPDHVCATERGWFGFHSAKEPSEDDDGKMVFSPDGTEVMWRAYPDNVQAWLTAHGFDYTKPHPVLLFAKATEFVKPCQ